MVSRNRIGAKAAVLACFFLCSAAGAQESVMDRVGAIVDDLGRGLDFVGKKASDLLGPGLGLDSGKKPQFIEAREFNERYPVGSKPAVSIASEFGEIRVETWTQRVVQVVAAISVGAESVDIAKETADAIHIRVTPAEDRIDVHTVLPDTRREMGRVAITVNYTLTVPEDTALVTENYFGDTLVQGIGGALAVEAQYGLVNVQDVSGAVHVRTRGEFPVEAKGLAQGGTFELNGAHGIFTNISGPLRVSSFRGTVEVRGLAPETDMDITNDSGSIVLELAEDAAPDLTATSLFGEVRSDIEMALSAQGRFTVARSPNSASKQRIALRSTFGDIYVKHQGVEAEAQVALVENTEPVKEVFSQTEPAAEGLELAVEAIPGDVRIEGIDEDQIRTTATKWVRVKDRNNVRAALDALEAAVERKEGGVTVRTRVLNDLAALGCVSYRIDVSIACPRTCPIKVRAEDGLTAISGTGGTVQVEQAAGTVSVEHAKGAVVLANRKGDIRVEECAGPVDVAAGYGNIWLTQVYGPAKAVCEEGKTVAEGLHAGLTVQNRRGDVRVIALEGITGDYDIRAEQGNVSILLPETSDAALHVTATHGMVYSSIPLTGSISQEVQEFHRQLQDGKYNVTLQVKEGDVRVN